ncbi:MAG: hypothetical protein LC781_22830 [Actinobacteria bacterium]|nr:hypothetical protein [Actinomycetota bacterium]
MDPEVQATGTRDEHYNLISVLYHALHGAESCEIYMADAEAADRGELAAFFREAQAMHAALAEQADNTGRSGGRCRSRKRRSHEWWCAGGRPAGCRFAGGRSPDDRRVAGDGAAPGRRPRRGDGWRRSGRPGSERRRCATGWGSEEGSPTRRSEDARPSAQDGRRAAEPQRAADEIEILAEPNRTRSGAYGPHRGR